MFVENSLLMTQFIPLWEKKQLEGHKIYSTMVRSLVLARLRPQFIASRMAQSASVRIQAFSTQLKEPITVSHTKARKETGNFHCIKTHDTKRYHEEAFSS